ncbi:hypothetical protein N665_0754s0005 [Sinapis alba]|nr:hypothetical protein N665_0754s0005 [Sinapis alba]
MDNTAEAEYARCKTSVWWDIENCAVPKGCDAHGITLKLSTALANMNYCGPLSISSYGNTDLIPKAVQHALSSTGISLNHVPSGRKDASDKKILVDMFLWVVENPPPANIMLISGDIDFSDALHRLRMRRYNILLAHPQKISPSLVASAKTSWLWRSLLASGSSLTQCESSGILDISEITSEDVSEHVLSTQPVDSRSGSSKDPCSKLKGLIYVPKAPNELLVKERKGKKLQKNCSENFSGKEHASQWELKQNLELLGKPEHMAAPPSDCHEKHMEIKNNVVEAGVEASSHFNSSSVEKKQAEALVDDAETVEDQEEPMKKCLEKKNNELIETTIKTSERSELENALAGPSEKLEEDMNKKKKRRKKKKNTVIEEDKAEEEPYVCSICNVICDSPAVFESHLKGRKHAATIEKLTEGLLDDKNIQEVIIQDNGQLIDITEEIQFKHGEASENIQEEMQERCGISEWSVGEFSQAFGDVVENDYTSLPNEVTELNSEFWSPKEAREWIDAIFNTPELSQDANLTREFERILNQSLEMKNSGDTAGITEHPEEFMDKVAKDKAEPEAYVCSICSVVCVCPIVFESHLMGRRHAAKVLFDDKKILEESLKEKDHPRDTKESIKEGVGQVIPSAEFQEPKEARERLDSIALLEDASKQTVVEAGSVSKRVEEENGTQTRVCDWCNVTCTSQMDFYSHLTGKKHASTVKKYEPVVKKQAAVSAVVKKQAGNKFAYVKKNGP